MEERIDGFLTAERWASNIRITEPDKCILLAWFPVNVLPETTIPYVAYGIRCWLAGIPFTTFGRNAQTRTIGGT